MQSFDPNMLLQAKNGDETATAALIARMMPTIRKGAAACMAPGLDYEDAVQEGLIGLFDAIRNYDPAREAAFAGYAATCIANAQQDASRKARRKKHAPLNDSVSLDIGAPAPSAVHGGADPEALAIAGEEYAEMLYRMETELSKMERRALLLFMAGRSAAESAELLHCAPKAAENALARARRKLKSFT